MVKSPAKPNVTSVTQRGKTYYYFRRRGKYIRLPDDPDSREFDEAYWRIRSGKARPAVKTTWQNLIESYLRSPAYLSKKPRTRQEYRRTIELIREKNGPKDFTRTKRRHVIQARDKYAETWRKANAMVETISILARHAIELEWIEANPASGVDKLTGGEYQPWPQDKLDAFERYCIAHDLTWELTAFKLGTGTGQRIGDLLKMKWEHFDGEHIQVTQEKTDARIWVACPPALKAYLSSLPRDGDYIIAKNLREPVSKRAIQTRVMYVRGKIKAVGYVIHGWRYTAAVELAEAGCSDSEIQAVTGHKTLSMVQKYRARANQKRLSSRAQARRK